MENYINELICERLVKWQLSTEQGCEYSVRNKNKETDIRRERWRATVTINRG